MHHRPDTVPQTAEIVRAAASDAQTLEIIGTATRRSLGHPVQAAATLDLSQLTGIIDYDPSELVVTARSGTPVAELTALLAASRQHFAFEPPDHAPLWGGPPGAGTLGGLVAAGLAGPRRIAAGGVRDHLLGFQAINGAGEIVVAGGKVLKNVTGYDLPKLMAGSWGTLAVLTEISLKALPAAPDTGSLVIAGLDPPQAIAAMTRALQGAIPVTGAAWLPGTPSRTLLRLEATPRVLKVQRDQLAAALAHPTDWLAADASRLLWHAISAVQPFEPSPESSLWRICLPATATPALLARLSDARFLLDWGGALIWLWQDLGDPTDPRAVLDHRDAHAVLVRAAPAHRHIAAFHPLPAPLAALTERVRRSFDPHGVFNPGRMTPRIA